MHSACHLQNPLGKRHHTLKGTSMTSSIHRTCLALLAATVISSVQARGDEPPVRGRSTSPLVSPGQETALMDMLQSPYEFHWNEDTTVEDIQGDLARYMEVRVSLLGLDELGLDLASKLNLCPTVTNVDPNPRRESWWQPSDAGKASDAKNPTLGAMLFYCLGQIDLTLSVVEGVVTIGTMDEMSEYGILRVYDVSQLMTLNPSSVHQNAPNGRNAICLKLNSIASMIQVSVEPDTWEALGGPSTMTFFQRGDDVSLIISTSLETHLRIEGLLNGLVKPGQ